MQALIEAIHKILGFIERSFGLMAGLVIMGLMVVVCAEVVGRSAFNHPIRGSIDIVSQMMAIAAAGGIPYTQSKFGNVRMTILTGRLENRPRWLAEVLTYAVAAWAVWVLMQGSTGFLERAWRSGADTAEIHIPTWIGISFVTVSLSLLLARLVLQLIESLRLLARPRASSLVFGITRPATAALNADKG
ncbi:TRAP transporter small permease [Pararhodobacter aggregans]|uniref:TRAP transporter small permease protein n=1 Tax=Pararhodobacter aggregans TaxID=404875 RepID=A0A2T7UMR5_9RHOB|nr:TRAP transporter small permease [Pararhodobacter aggregans]PTW99385.1 TRAP-type C4-dicarboxylate transport system permease small subunit [Pararhodobacter aggregans]PVE45928.1 TRAP transporter small permease [Pararhodobacter aggregans]